MNLLQSAIALQDKAKETLNQKRLVNTHKRLKDTQRIENRARQQLQLAATMKNIHYSHNILLFNFKKKNQVECFFNLIKCNQTEFPYPYVFSDFDNKLPEFATINDIDLNQYLQDEKYIFNTDVSILFLQKYFNFCKLNEVEPNWCLQETFKEYKIVMSICNNDIKSYHSIFNAFKTCMSEKIEESKIVKLERELIGRNIPGYYPTPEPVIEKMINYACMCDNLKVLEPSAGKGSIADYITQRYIVNIDVIEPNKSLQEILKEKRYSIIHHDFLKLNVDKYDELNYTEEYDRIIMNPPFELFQDIDHVLHAYKCLKRSGVLVSIMSEGVFFRSDIKSCYFREWLYNNNGYSIKLPKGSFLESDRKTGVNCRIVVIQK